MAHRLHRRLYRRRVALEAQCIAGAAMYQKTSLQLTLLAAVRGLLPPLVSTTVLIVSTKMLDVRFTSDYVALALISALLAWIAISTDKSTRAALPPRPLAVAGETVVEWCAVVATLLLVGYATKTSASFSRRALFLWFTITPPLVIATLTIVDAWMRAIVASRRNARKAVIVGENATSAKLAEMLGDRSELGLRLERTLDVLPSRSRRVRSTTERSSSAATVRDYVNLHRIEVVFIALPIESETTRAILDSLRDTTSSVYLLPDVAVHDLVQAHSDEIEGIPVIALCESPFRGVRGFAKRITDVVFATILLFCALPVMVAIAVVIKVTSNGSVLFKQHRYGLDGERITVYKFRTMLVAQDGPSVPQAKRDDPRVTPIGRFLRRTSLDELPQLINVLRGNMSLVGPRPHAVAHNERYRKLIRGYMVRHKVAPGITGLAQVNGCRGETATLEDMRRRVEYDLEYLRRWCWSLDVKILVKTAALLFGDKRAY